jgi:hypothetical protein
MRQRAGLAGAALVVAFFVALSPNAFGYLDPGSASYLFGLLIAGFAGALYYAKGLWIRAWYAVVRAFGKEHKPSEQDDTNA